MKTEINLLPINPHKRNISKSLRINPWLGFILGALVLFSLSYGVLTLMNQNRLEKIKQIEEVIENQRNFQIPYEDLKTKNELLKYRNKLTAVLNPERSIPLNVLIGVQDAISLNMELMDYQFNENALTLVGNAQNQEDILAFREKLMASGLFEDVSIENILREANLKSPGTNIIEESLNRDEWNFILKIEVVGADEI